MQNEGTCVGLKKISIAGVTLLEVIIAIIIFGTGIVSIMSLLSSNIGWLYDINQRDTALTIAKEGIDLVYHLRDSNIERGMFWNCGLIDFSATDNCAAYFHTSGTGTEYIINRSVGDRYELTEVVTETDKEIYFHEGTLYSFSGTSLEGYIYNHNPTEFGGIDGEKTIYKRTIEFKPLSGYASWTGNVLEIRSIVEFDRGNTVESVILQSIIGDIRI